MITFVCWKWKPQQPTSREFTSEPVNVLRRQVKRHYRRPHRFVCITDDPAGLDERVEVLPMSDTGLEDLRTLLEPITKNGRRFYFPSCFRRLWMFSREAEQLGERVFSLDLDCLIVGSLEPLIDDFPGDFVGWVRATNPRRQKPALAGAVYKLKTGSHPEVWDDFDPVESPAIARRAGYSGSDQAWMSYKLLPTSDCMWTDADGLGKPQMASPTSRDRILFTSGYAPPWSKELQARRPWVAEHWESLVRG